MAAADINDHKPATIIIIVPTILFSAITLSNRKNPLDTKKILHRY
jgi:hypothetical protein